MRVKDIRENSIRIHRHAQPNALSGELTTSLVEIVIDPGSGAPSVTGRGFSSIGRYAQGGLIRERFAPRLLRASPACLLNEEGKLDPIKAWDVLMTGEKPGGHGDRAVAVGTLDMALWDIAAKMAREPLHATIARLIDEPQRTGPRIPVYASGGYLYPDDDLSRLADEFSRMVDLGFTCAKMKVGATDSSRDLQRIDVAARAIGGHDRLAVDAMNGLSPEATIDFARRLQPLGLRWFEDACDPLDFETQATLAKQYAGRIGAGEALFSVAEARLLDRYAGLRRDRDLLIFDPVHCYGLSGYLRIVRELTATGWPRSAFFPHGGHMFCVHVAAALGMGGAEVNPFAFHPFADLPVSLIVNAGFSIAAEVKHVILVP